SCLDFFFFFFQAEDGIRDFHVTGVQTCALPIYGQRQNPDKRAQASDAFPEPEVFRYIHARPSSASPSPIKAATRHSPCSPAISTRKILPMTRPSRIIPEIGRAHV